MEQKIVWPHPDELIANIKCALIGLSEEVRLAKFNEDWVAEAQYSEELDDLLDVLFTTMHPVVSV